MSVFSEFNEGISYKIPSFLFPTNQINYYNGPIPDFKKAILNKKLEKKYFELIKHLDDPHKKLKHLNNKVRNKFKEKDIHNISIDNGNIRIKFNEGFYLYDIIWIDDFIRMEDSYEKACLANAFTCIHNENDQILDYYKSMYDDVINNQNDVEEYEYDSYTNELTLFKKIDVFLSLKPKDFRKQKFKNRISKYIIQHIFYHRKFLSECYSMLQKEDSAYNIGVKYIADFDDLEIDYDNIETTLQYNGFLEREETDFYFTLDNNLNIKEKELIDYGDKVHYFNFKLNKLLRLWQIQNMQLQIHKG